MNADEFYALHEKEPLKMLAFLWIVKGIALGFGMFLFFSLLYVITSS